MNTTITTVQVDKLVQEDNKNIRKIFYNHIFGNQENSVQIISYLLDNYINTPYIDENNDLVLQGYIPRQVYSLAEHPYLHESAYQAFAIHTKEDFDWNKYPIFERRLQIFLLICKKFSNVLNENHFINGYGFTAIQEISLNFDEKKFQYYPDYFKDYVQEHIIDKYDLINALPLIKKSFDFGRRPPPLTAFKVYTKKLVEFYRE